MIAHTRISRIGLGTLVAVLLLAFGASVLAQPAGAPKPLGSLTLGVGIDASYASVVVAVHKGQMKKHGIDATLKVFPSGQEALEAVLTGQADFTGNGQYNIPLVAAKGGNIKIIAEYERSDQQFGAAGKASINSPADLLGKKVGTQFGTSPDYYYHLYTKFYGLDESKITLVNVRQGRHRRVLRL
jgi:NitT/TauT family transport system substrate-binding protein